MENEPSLQEEASGPECQLWKLKKGSSLLLLPTGAWS